MKRPAGMLLLAAAIGAVSWWYGLAGDAADARPAPASPAPPAPAPERRPGQVSGPSAPLAQEGDGMRRVPLPSIDAQAPAWVSLAQARTDGDARTPPIERDAPEAHASAAQMADAAAYARFEKEQSQRLLASFASAAGPEVERLRADLERGRAAGVTAAELAKMEEKIRRIEQQRKAAASTLPNQ